MIKVKQKGQKFFKSLTRGNVISRKNAKSRWAMGNPSAWVKIFKDSSTDAFSPYFAPEMTIQRKYNTRFNRNGRMIRTVEYSMVRKNP